MRAAFRSDAYLRALLLVGTVSALGWGFGRCLPEGPPAAPLSLGVLSGALAGALLGALPLARERESGTVDLLVLGGMRARDIVLGHYGAAWLRGAIALSGAMPFFLSPPRMAGLGAAGVVLAASLPLAALSVSVALAVCVASWIGRARASLVASLLVTGGALGLLAVACGVDGPRWLWRLCAHVTAAAGPADVVRFVVLPAYWGLATIAVFLVAAGARIVRARDARGAVRRLAVVLVGTYLALAVVAVALEGEPYGGGWMAARVALLSHVFLVLYALAARRPTLVSASVPLALAACVVASIAITHGRVPWDVLGRIACTALGAAALLVFVVGTRSFVARLNGAGYAERIVVVSVGAFFLVLATAASALPSDSTPPMAAIAGRFSPLLPFELATAWPPPAPDEVMPFVVLYACLGLAFHAAGRGLPGSRRELAAGDRGGRVGGDGSRMGVAVRARAGAGGMRGLGRGG